mmetsp:Transcript_33760/g.84728  ORF Transcript_33760/g.84728 Transcript_33760/m.84728 type:complete len:202 (-) Transcript_33760:199-804(-)
MPLSLSLFASVHPAMNHSNSCATPRQNTRLVVRSGKECARLNRMTTPNTDTVPTPVRSPRVTPLSRMCLMRSRYWCSACTPACAATLAGGGTAGVYFKMSYSRSFSVFFPVRDEHCENRDGTSGKNTSHLYRRASRVINRAVQAGCASAAAYTCAPPITNTPSTSHRRVSHTYASAASRLGCTTTPAGASARVLESTMFSL